ncbi:hypothetical protein KMZ15_03365 [Mycoavidus sp. HKI]|uniref:hypothetical protein n=1 Tax=Mycoavidus sp. HKI TaxID=2840467 RepID=UPI001CBFB484|nr:hypothetical protein [Mycoavidus sp. HKI]UAW64719.1 hypothetical protein KMZ15_03365 [Mycoavidus sp. HKI]
MTVNNNAQRQRTYRDRHLREGLAKRLNIIIEPDSKWTLELLAKCYGVTQRMIIEKLLLQAEIDITARIIREEADYDIAKSRVRDYYGGRLRLKSELFTPSLNSDSQPISVTA